MYNVPYNNNITTAVWPWSEEIRMNPAGKHRSVIACKSGGGQNDSGL